MFNVLIIVYELLEREEHSTKVLRLSGECCILELMMEFVKVSHSSPYRF